MLPPTASVNEAFQRVYWTGLPLWFKHSRSVSHRRVLSGNGAGCGCNSTAVSSTTLHGSTSYCHTTNDLEMKAAIMKTHPDTHTHTDRQTKVTLRACAED